MQDRFTVKYGTVLDNKTGLMWMQEPSKDTFSFDEALEITSDYDGFIDWRLPTIDELNTIVDRGKQCPAANESFEFNSSGLSFWSSSLHAGNTNFAWAVNFYHGHVDHHYRPNGFAVRLVRATHD